MRVSMRPHVLRNEVDGRTAGERVLGLFARVHAGEGRIAVLLAADIFLILTAYYVLKVVREPLILTGGAFGLRGATLKSAAAAGQAMLLLAIVPAYGALARRVDRRRLMDVVSAIFIACLAAFAGLGALAAPIGLAFFVWLGVFSVMVVAQFWSFANDIDVLSLALVAVATGPLGLGVAAMSAVNLVLVGACVALAIAIGRRNRALMEARR